jgi:hypothetical protein
MATSSGRKLVAAACGAAVLMAIAILAPWQHSGFTTVPSTDTALHSVGATGPPLQIRARAWLRDAQPVIHDLFVAGDVALIDAAHGDAVGAAAACRGAGGAAAGLQQHLPSPDGAANVLLQEAIGDYRTGIRHCLAGERGLAAKHSEAASNFIKLGGAELQSAIEILLGDEYNAPRDRRVLTA